MVHITERQKQILECIVAEYIEQAQPISSQLLEKKYDLGLSSATLRNEMLALSRKGFLAKLHTSSGRVPTDKGYRFFVNELGEKKGAKIGFQETFLRQAKEEGEGILDFAWHIARNLASLSSGLGAVYLSKGEIFWKEGWEDVLEEPEFEDQKSIQSFTKFIGDFEENLQKFSLRKEVQVFIGKENSFSKVKDFSIMLAECAFPENEKAIIALLGPKRMAYPENIHILNTLVQMVENPHHD